MSEDHWLVGPDRPRQPWRNRLAAVAVVGVVAVVALWSCTGVRAEVVTACPGGPTVIRIADDGGWWYGAGPAAWGSSGQANVRGRLVVDAGPDGASFEGSDGVRARLHRSDPIAPESIECEP